jgi:hypothetical protein
MSNAARKSQLLALARSGGAAAVGEHGPDLWPSSVRINGNSYVLRSKAPSSTSPYVVLGFYYWSDRCIALRLEAAQRGSRSANGFS